MPLYHTEDQAMLAETVTGFIADEGDGMICDDGDAVRTNHRPGISIQPGWDIECQHHAIEGVDGGDQAAQFTVKWAL